MKHRIRVGAACAAATVLLAGATAPSHAQEKASAPVSLSASPSAPPPLDSAARSAIVDKVAAILREYYVYPDVAAKMEARLREQLKSGAYDKITRMDQFSHALTGDMHAVSNDRHLGIAFRPDGSVGPGEEEMTPREHEKQNRDLRRFGDAQNWGFVKAEVLPGNVGYLDLRFFGHPEWAGDTVANAMAFLSKTDALILDLRANGGGYPQTVALLLSYLMERPSIHGGTEEIPLFLQNDRRAGTVSTIKTFPYVPGKKYLRDVYVLTSRRSFSGAELFADAVKTHKRAVLIGEKTAGGAHSMLTRPINAYLEMGVSFGWTKNVVTGDDWEGKGILPDVAVPAQTALAEAHLRALKKIAAKVEPSEKPRLIGAIADAERALAQAQPKGPLDGNTEFRLGGHPNAKAVFLAGEFNRFDPQATPMVRNGKDGWIVRIDLSPGKYAYKFVVDGQWLMDPGNKDKATDQWGYENSVRTVPLPGK